MNKLLKVIEYRKTDKRVIHVKLASLHLYDTPIDYFIPYNNEVYSQNGISSTSCVLASYLYFINTLNANTKNMSRLFIFNQEILNTNTCAILGVLSHGVCEDSFYPHTLFGDSIPNISKLAIANASINKYFNKLYNLPLHPDCMKTYLSKGIPLIIDMRIYSSFKDLRDDGLYYPDVHKEDIIGYHEVLCLGYTYQGLRCLNSYGKDWGLDGYFILPWTFVTHIFAVFSLINFENDESTTMLLIKVTEKIAQALGLINQILKTPT